MSVSAEELVAIDNALNRTAGLSEILLALRTEFPHLRWLSCDAADVSEEPFRAYPLADMYFLDCAGHCVQVVAQAEDASGVLLARRGGA